MERSNAVAGNEYPRDYRALIATIGTGTDCEINMLEAVVIIIALGGLELILWYLDHRQQKKQIELLDSIWAELAIRNSAEEEAKPSRHS